MSQTPQTPQPSQTSQPSQPSQIPQPSQTPQPSQASTTPRPSQPRQPAPPARTDVPPAWDERTQLATFLDYVRATVRDKCAGVSPEDAVKAPLPGSPLMTLCGLVSHLRWVEYFWFEVIFLGQEDQGPWTDEDPDREMRIAVDVPLGRLLAEYEEQSVRHRELVASHDLDDRAVAETRNGLRPDLRWIVLHLIEETARHNGHIDILRELADGVTGD